MNEIIALYQNVGLGFSVALSATNLWYCFVGVFLGMLVGVLPGVGALAAITLLLPLTFYLDPTSAIVMLAGVYYGTAYGGSTASILLNVPGSPSSAVTCLDGYPMAQQGRAGVALLVTAVASFAGGSIGILIMMLFSPVIAGAALQFGPAEYSSIMILGLVAAATMSGGSPAKGLAMVVLGVLLSSVGADLNSGVKRFTYGLPGLYNGIGLVFIAMGLFGVTEVIASITKIADKYDPRNRITFRSMVPTRDDGRRFWWPMLRGSGIGSFFGALPGAGGTMASFMAYAAERRIAREPTRFGKGAVEGIVAPEAANNAADQTAFIPTMTLGIPGSAVMALMLGALMIHGIAPGPNLVAERPELFWGLIMSFWIGNLILLILNIPLIGIWIKVLLIPYKLLYPAILMLICLGAYSIDGKYFGVLVILVFGVFGYILRLLEFEAAPLLLGFVLGPLLEENFRRTLLISRGDFAVFVERPISAVMLLATVSLLALVLWSGLRPRKSKPVTG